MDIMQGLENNTIYKPCPGETLTATPFTGDTGAGITRDREPVDLSGSTAREQLQQ